MRFETVNPPRAKELLDADEGWTYLDVRTPEEFEAGHAPGAYNVPVATRAGGGMQPNPGFVETVTKHFAADAPLVVACAMGGRSARACEMLSSAGFTRLANMHGGWSGAPDPTTGRMAEPGWSACGFPSETGPGDAGRSWRDLRA